MKWTCGGLPFDEGQGTNEELGVGSWKLETIDGEKEAEDGRGASSTAPFRRKSP
jgi:hypothetical protein